MNSGKFSNMRRRGALAAFFRCLWDNGSPESGAERTGRKSVPASGSVRKNASRCFSAAVFLSALLLASCGGDGNDGISLTPPTPGADGDLQACNSGNVQTQESESACADEEARTGCEGGEIQQPGNICVCPPGQEEFADGCAEPVACEGGEVTPPVNQCVCEAGFEEVEGECVEECESGRERVGPHCEYECGSNEIRGDDGRCACIEGFEEVARSCVRECLPGEERVMDICVSECGENEVRQGLNCVCDESFAESDGSCAEACPPGEERVGEECLAECGTNEVRDGGNCRCAAGFMELDGSCAADCAARGQVEAEGGGCRSPSGISECVEAGLGEVIENGSCASACLSGRIADPVSQICRQRVAGGGVSGGNLSLPPPPEDEGPGYDPLAIPLLPAAALASTETYQTEEFENQPGLARVRAEAAYQRGYFGQGVTVAIVDTGVDPHPEFGDRLVPGFNAIAYTNESDDSGGHGTFVAGIVGAAMDGVTMHGIAPSASIMPLKTANDAGRLAGDEVAAFRHGTENGVLVFNNSYGISEERVVLLTNLPPGHRLAAAEGITLLAEIPRMAEAWTVSSPLGSPRIANEARKSDAIFVWAAGNEEWREDSNEFEVCERDPDSPSNIRRCKIDGERFEMSPAEFLQYAYDTDSDSLLSEEGLNVNSAGFFSELPLVYGDLQGQWLAVGATESTSDEAASFSNGCGLSKYWCLFAPGQGVYSTSTNDRYRSGSGTSYSAPFVSGGLALLKSRLPSMPMEAVRALLLYTSEDLGDPGVDDIYGWGRMDIERAVTFQTSLTVRVAQPIPVAEAARPLEIDLSPPSAPNASLNFRTPEFERQYGLSRIGADAAYWRGYFGQGATVAYVGSGMLTTHAELRENAVPGADIVTKGRAVSAGFTWPINPYGYGTFYGGVIGAAMDGSGMHGVAPSASIMPLNIANRFGRLTGSSGDAFDIALEGGAHVINAGFRYIRTEFGEYRGTLYHALLPYTFVREEQRGLTGISYSAGIAERANRNDAIVVVPAGNDGWNSVNGRIQLCDDLESRMKYLGCPDGYVEVSPEEFIQGFTFKNLTVTATITLHALDSEGATLESTTNVRRSRTTPSWDDQTLENLASLFPVSINSPGDQAYGPMFNESLQDNWLVAVATDQNDVIAPFSNGCGDAKFWCLSAPGVSIYSAAASRGYTVDSDGGSAAAHVSGALALLKSRLPGVPMEALRAILLYTAEDLGDPGVDDVYGWGLVNIERAITLQGRFTVVAGEHGLLVTAEGGGASARGVNLQGARIQLPSALSHVEAGLAGVSVAVGGIGNAHYNAPLSDFVEVRDVPAEVAHADAAADMLTTDERRFQAGNLFAAADAKSGQFQYAGALVDAGPLGAWSFRGDFCDDCIASVWPEWQAADAAKLSARQAAFQGYDAMEPALGGFEIMPSSLPFFARESGEASFMASMRGEGLRPFAAVGEGDAPYRQYGLRWRKSLVGGLGLLAEASEVRESETFWGADFGSLGRASAQTRQARLFAGGDLNEEWRGFGGYEASFGAAEAEGGALLREVSGMRSSEWSAGLERRDVFSWGDALRARVSWRRVSGGEAVISHAVADEEECDFTCAFYGSLGDTPEYLVAGEQELESRESRVSLSSSASWSAALGYAFRSSRKSRVSLGASHASEGMTTFSAAIRAEF